MLVNSARVFKQLVPLERLKLVLALVARIVANGLDVAALSGVALLGAALAGGLTGEQVDQVLGLEFQTGSQGSYLLLGGLIVGLFLLKGVISIWLVWKTNMILAAVETNHASRVFSTLFGEELSSYSGSSRGDLIFASTAGSTYTFSVLPRAASTIVVETSLLIGIFSVLVWVNPSTAVFAIAYLVALVVLLQRVLNRQLLKIGVIQKEKSVALVDSVQDTLAVYKEEHVFGLFPRRVDDFRNARKAQAEAGGIQRVLQQTPRYVIDAFLIIGVFALLLFQVGSGATSEGLVGVGVFLVGGFRVVGALIPVQNAYSEAKVATPLATPVLEILEKRFPRESDWVQRGTAYRHGPNSTKPLDVEVSNLTYRRREDSHATFENFSLSVRPGEFVVVTGDSGSGKTTLLDLIAGIEHPDAGTIRIGGETVVDALARHKGLVAYVPQAPRIISGSLLDNVTLRDGQSQVERVEVQRLFRKLGIEYLITRHADGLDQRLVGNLAEFSGGELLRIGLSRALIRSPKLILVDEPTSALDPESERTVNAVLEELVEKCTIVAVSHKTDNFGPKVRFFSITD